MKQERSLPRLSLFLWQSLAFSCLVWLTFAPLVQGFACDYLQSQHFILSANVADSSEISTKTQTISVAVTWKAIHEALLSNEDIRCEFKVTGHAPIEPFVSPFYLLNTTLPTSPSWQFVLHPSQDGTWHGEWNYTLGLKGVSLTPLNASVIVNVPLPTLVLSHIDGNNERVVFSKTVSSPLAVEMKLYISNYMGHREAIIAAAAVLVFVLLVYLFSSHQLNKALSTMEQERKEREERRRQKALEVAAQKANESVAGEGQAELKPVVFKAKQERRRFVKKPPTKASGIEF